MLHAIYVRCLNETHATVGRMPMQEGDAMSKESQGGRVYERRAGRGGGAALL